MADHQHRRAIGVFSDRPTTASALQALQDSGFSQSQVSIIARDAEHQAAIAGVDVTDQRGNKADQGGAIGAVTGGVLGGVAGLLVGLGTLVIPGIGPAFLAGEAAAVISTLVGGAAGAAAGGLVGALIGLGVPEDRARQYHDRVARGDYLLMLKGTDPELRRASDVLHHYGIQDWGIYDQPDQGKVVATKQSEHRAEHRAEVDPQVRPTADPQLIQRSVVNPISSAPVPPVLPPNEPLKGDRPDSVEAPIREVRSPDQTQMRSPAPPTAPAENLIPVEEHTPTAYPVDPNTDYRPARPPENLGSPSIGSTASSTANSPTNSPIDSTVVTNRGAEASEKRAIGIFANQQRMETALNALKADGFTMHKISIAVRDSDSSSAALGLGNRSGLNSAAGLLAGLNEVTIPDWGRMFLLGAEAPELARLAQERRVGNMTQLLTALGIPEAQALHYCDRLAQEAYLVMVKGSSEEALQAASILSRLGIEDWGIYDISHASSTSSATSTSATDWNQILREPIDRIL